MKLLLVLLATITAVFARSLEGEALLDALLIDSSSKDEIIKKINQLENDQSTKTSAQEDERLFKRMIELKEEKAKKEVSSVIDAKQFLNSIMKDDACKDDRPDCTQELCNMGYTNTCKKTCQICKLCKEDVWEGCERYKRYCDSDQHGERLKKYCHKTCGHCKQRSPPACENHLRGCCWDLSIREKDGTCQRECKDYHSFCKRFSEGGDCEKQDASGDFMRNSCPQSCGVCAKALEMNRIRAKKCFDKPGMKTAREDLCSTYKKYGYCEDEYIKQEACPKTCGWCF